MLSLPHDDDVKITEKQKADATAADAAETVAAEKVKAEAATVAVKKAADTSVRIPEDGQIYISEIMFAGKVVHCRSGLRSPTVPGRKRSI